MCDGVLYPRMTAGEAAWKCWSGPPRATVPAREGRLTASPGTGLPLSVQPVGPRPLVMVVQCIQAYNRALRQK